MQLDMMVFGCAATGMINFQMVEGGKNTGCVLDDTTLLDDIRAVHEEADRILDTTKIVSNEELWFTRKRGIRCRFY